MLTTPKLLDWHQCYKNGWKNEIVPDAFQHPAKYSRRLIARIYDHLLAEDLVRAGDKVCDPFGGVALGALDAMRLGLHWTGNELEEKFVHLGRANIELWNARYATMPNWGTAQLLQGDSRKFAAIVGAARACVSSPPYAESVMGATDYDERMQRLLQQPFEGLAPRWQREVTKYKRVHVSTSHHQMTVATYNKNNIHNLGSLSAGDFRAVVSSPPYEEARVGESSGAEHVGHNENYGSGAGQLGNMLGGDFAAAVSSPPFEKSLGSTDETFLSQLQTKNPNGSYRPRTGGWKGDAVLYGESVGNIGNDSGETFWVASRTIVEQVHSVLAPRGVAVWVVKDFVRNKMRVPFCDQWRQLCEHVGFETMYVARAWLVEENVMQLAHDGNHKNLSKSRKSFFRRLNEAKGAPKIDWEEIIFMVKA